MSFASYCPPLAARDVETTSEVKESKDYGSGSSVAEVDPPRQRSPTVDDISSVDSISRRSDDKGKYTESSQRIWQWVKGDSTWHDPWSPLTQRSFADFRDNDNVMAKLEQVDYAEDLMQSIRSRVLKVCENRQSTRLEMFLFVSCNVRGFMEKQFDGSNENLGRVITLSGTATHGQATTCSDYIRTNWPLRGPWLLDMLQVTFDGARRIAKGDQPFQSIVTLDHFQS